MSCWQLAPKHRASARSSSVKCFCINQMPPKYRVYASSLASIPKHLLLGSCALALSACVATHPAHAYRDKVGEFAASGFLFKDTVEVTAFDDPDVKGVTVYISDFKRSIVDKLAKDFFTEPSQASLTCAVSGEIVIKDYRQLDAGSEGREIFSERKGFSIFKDKTLRVRRLYDPERSTIVYVAYSTRLTNAADEGVSGGRYRTSICAVPLVPATVAAPAPALVDAASNN